MPMPTPSPRVQQMQMASGAGVDQATALFEQGFSQMAYNVLLSKLPDIVNDVVTFKILDTDIETGTGVGAFVLMHNDQPLYVPVVMSDNNVKPIEMVYHKALNIFLPLSKQWLDEIDKTVLSSLGHGVKTPETLYTDVDIRNVVVPPITGRFSYAAWEPIILADVAKVINKGTLEKMASAPAMLLLDFLSKAPNTVKTAFAKTLEKNPKLLKRAAEIYGVNALTTALRSTQKTAAKQHYGGALWIADQDTTPTEFKRIFGDRAAEAYAGVRKKGFAAKDERLKRNMAVQEQPFEHWVEPRQPGIYTLYDAEHKEKPAFVMANPIDILSDGNRYTRRPVVPGRNPLTNNSATDPSQYQANRYYPDGRPDETDYVQSRHGVPEYLAVLANGDYLQVDRLVGRESVVDDLGGGTLEQRLFKDLAGEPRKGIGFWVRQRGTTYQATVPVEIEAITTDSDGIRRVKYNHVGGFGEGKTAITDKHSPYNTIFMPKGGNITYVPSDFVWVPLKEKLKKGDFFTSALDLASCALSALVSVGVKKVSIKNAGASQFSIDGGPGLNHIPALKKLAYECVLSVDDAERLLTKATAERHIQFWPVSYEKLAQAQLLLEKRGQDEPPKKKEKKSAPPSGGAEGGEDPNADPMADPAAQEAAMMAMQQQEAAAAQPTPTDLAAMEMQQHIDAEMMKLQERSQMLVALTQRANEIAGGAPPMPTVQTQAMGAPPPSANLATGAPAPGGMPGMSPQGGMPAPGGMPGAPAPGGMPGMGQPPMGMGQGDPSMGMGGMDPSMSPMLGADQAAMGQGGAPPMAMMGTDGPSESEIASQINPQFLGQAAQLHSNDIFDAAAVSNLAQSPAIKELVGQYLPNLEKALDNLSRVLLTLWMQETELKKEIGEMSFADIENNLRTTFKNLGDLVLKLSQGAHAIQGQFEHENA